MQLTTFLVPAPGMNDADKWRLWEEHSDCNTATLDLENGLYVMKCVEHNVPHIIATQQV